MWFARSCEGRTQTPEGRRPTCGDVPGPQWGHEEGEPPAQPDRMQHAGMSGTKETHVEGDG